MTASIRTRKTWALLTALLTMAALVAPLANTASANHTGPSTAEYLINVEPETDTNNLGTTHTLTATVTDTGGTTDSVQGVEVDFEIDCFTDCGDSAYTIQASSAAGGPTSAPEAGVNGDQANDTTDDIRTTPELSCTTDASGTCTVSYTRHDVGQDYIVGFVDDDKNNSTNNAGNDSDPTEVPGDAESDDDTDVVIKTWQTGLAAGAVLDCDDDDNTDSETNPAGQSETYTCTLFNDNGAGGGTAGDAIQNGSEPGISGMNIDAENLAGANDPDNSSAAGTADFNNACVTGGTGTCTFVLAPSENEVGTANVCFWADSDNDAVFNPASDQTDGGECDNEAFGVDDADITDVVQKTWATQGTTAAVLDAEPEVDNNPSGTSHTITATVMDQFGSPVANQNVDFFVLGSASRNDNGATDKMICDNVTTNASGVATCTYTDTGTASSSGQDWISVFLDQNDDDVADQDAGGDEDLNNATATAAVGNAAQAVNDQDLSDTVTKFWTAGGPPAAGSVIVDMTTLDDCNDPADSADTQQVNNVNPICGVVLDAGGNPIPGATVTITTTGVGRQGTATTDQGQSQTITTDVNGQWTANLFSLQSGTQTVTATSGSVSDTGTKTWTGETDARNIECDPATATNPTQTEHEIICTVTDRFGNPIAGEMVTVRIQGPGRVSGQTGGFFGSCLTSSQTNCSFTTDSLGQVRIPITSPSAGTSTVTIRLGDDATVGTGAEWAEDTDTTDPCEQPANTPTAGDPAGNCSVTVEKTWTAVQLPECDDGIDNDGDTFIDHPADTDCTSEADNSESGATNVDHARTAKITRMKHVDLGGKRGRSLLVKGTVVADDGFTACASNVPVKIQLRKAGEWFTRKSDTTSGTGRWKVLIRDVPGNYRVVAPLFQINDATANQVHSCLKAKDGQAHRHG